MADLVIRVVDALRHEHQTLTDVVAGLDEAALAMPSGAADWTIAQVLSHLGSGAEIGRRPVAHAAGEPVPEETNEAVWQRWDAAPPVDQAEGFLRHGNAYLETVERLPQEQHGSLRVDLGFLPEPVPLVTALGMRLNEVANHSWDVRAGIDPAAEVDEDSAGALLELFRGPLAFLLGFAGQPAELAAPARVAVPGGGIEIGETVAVIEAVAEPDTTVTGTSGSTIRLLSGRLRAPYLHDIEVGGALSLADLRRVFPGY